MGKNRPNDKRDTDNYEHAITDEVLYTDVIGIERSLNNSPLVRVTEDTEEGTVLTPSKLLLLEGADLTTKYDRRWKQAQHIASLF